MNVDVGGILGSYQPMFKLVGIVTVSYVCVRILWTLIHLIKVCYLSSLLGLHADFKSYGPWAAVTGSTDGIGKCYAEQLAKYGLNIALLSRSKDKLENVAREIETKYKVKTKIIVVDFTGGQELCDTVTKALEGLDIGILVNNVGMALAYPEYFLDIPDVDKFVSDIINVNILAVTNMTKVILPQMVQRKKGLVINVASSSGKMPVPLLNIYSATKAYMDFFSRALDVEYSSKGIVVQSVLPFFVSTKMSRLKPSFMTPSAQDYVKQSLGTVGLESRTHGYISHQIQGLLMDILPESVTSNTVVGLLKKARQRTLNKLAKKNQ